MSAGRGRLDQLGGGPHGQPQNPQRVNNPLPFPHPNPPHHLALNRSGPAQQAQPLHPIDPQLLANPTLHNQIRAARPPYPADFAPWGPEWAMEALVRSLAKRLDAAEAKILEQQGELEVQGEAATRLVEQVGHLQNQVAELEARLDEMAEDVDNNDDEDIEMGEGEDKDDEDEGEDDDEDDDEGEAAAEDDDEDQQAAHLPFVCGVAGCNFEFKAKSTLDRHKAATHLSDPASRKAHVCPICSASFDTIAALNGHRKQHDPAYIAERNRLRLPVPGGCACPLCGHECVSRLNRRDHLAKSHKNWRTLLPNFRY